MKATIITIYDPNPNYGNRLQNYALQEVLKHYFHEVNTISFEQRKPNMKTMVKYIIQKVAGFRIKGDTNYYKYHIPHVLVFNRFNRKYINTIRVKEINEAKSLKADCFIIGSDQVWNPTYYDTDLKKNIYLAAFTQKTPKLSVSASFGVNQIASNWTCFFTEQLQTFQGISVREKAGAAIVNELIGHMPEVLVDPTLMLNAEDWSGIAKCPDGFATDKPYVLTYFLGGRDSRAEEEINKIKQKYNMEVYHLLDYSNPAVYVTGPCEFIYLISRSSIVLTDSFHACVFSFLFKKPFLVYKRRGADMMSRIHTLLETFGLERKFVESGLENELFENDYEYGHTRLIEERTRVYDFLEKYLKD